MLTIKIDEINKEMLGQKLKLILNKRNLKAQAKEIANLLHHTSVDLASSAVSAKEPVNHNTQTSVQLSTTHLHLDALGALFFVIFVIVKLSLKFCRFYNNWKADVTPGCSSNLKKKKWGVSV